MMRMFVVVSSKHGHKDEIIPALLTTDLILLMAWAGLSSQAQVHTPL